VTGAPTSAVTYQSTLDGVSADDLEGFFEGWPSPSSSRTLLGVIHGSDYVVVARAGGSQVVGLIAAITDGVLTAFVTLLEVLPGHRNHGIGSELVGRVRDHSAELYGIDVLCDAELVPFYERLGFRPAAAASIRRYDRQAGVDGPP
jgi:GNAT superfamily N-acetyltransferase